MRTVPIPTKHLARILPLLPPRVRAYAILAFSTGLRASEILSLRWSQVDLQDANPRITFTPCKHKSNRAATVPISAWICNQIEPLRNITSPTLLHDFVFANPNKPMRKPTTRGINLALERACQRAGITERYSTHSLRKTFAQTLYDLTSRDIVATQHALHHQSPSSTAHYIGSNDLELADQITRTALELKSQALRPPTCE